ncbi:hypothetical protein DW937_12095 [Faecalibacterium sp. AM43-5AT]|nr:hypothetical protein DW937_12095 [Faecalibacterium sp. AM43-5AT]
MENPPFWIVAEGGSAYCCRPLDCRTAKTGGTVNGGRSPFILTVDWLGWFCYLLTAIHSH